MIYNTYSNIEKRLASIEKMLKNQSTTNAHSQSINDKEKLFTRQELAKFLKVTKQTIINWEKSGLITSIRMGNLLRYRSSDIDAFINQ